MVCRRWISVLLAALTLVSVSWRISFAKAQANPSAGMNWQPTLDEAKRVAASSNRLILVHFWAPSCKECVRLDKDVYSQVQVQEAINARFVPLKLNADDFPTTTRQYGVDRLPTDLIITPAGQIVGRMRCPTTADAYLQQLNVVASAAAPMTNVANAAVPTSPLAASMNPTASSKYTIPALPATPVYGVQPAANPYAATANPPVMTNPSAALQPPAYAPAAAQPAGIAAAPPQYGAQIQQPMAQSVPPVKAPSMPAYSDDRYSEYFQRFSNQPAATAPGVATAPMSAGIAAPVAAPQYSPPIARAPQYNPPIANPVQYNSPLTAQASIPAASAAPMGAGLVASSPAAVNWPVNPAATATAAAPSAAGPSMVGLPTGTITGLTPGLPAQAPAAAAGPALGLEGYCPVTLADQKRWQVGDRRYGVIHRGRTYLFAGPVEQQKFLSNPDRYSPAIAGQDVVLALDQGQTIEGKRQFGVEYQNRFYLFSSDATRRAFSQNPKRYAAEVLQAENPNRPSLR